MKKLVLTVAVLTASITAFAQKSEVAEAKKNWEFFQAMNAKNNLAKNLDLLEKGLKHTDNAVVHKSTNNNLEAWTLRASMSSAIAVLDSVREDNALAKQKIAEEAIAKAKTLDSKGEKSEDLKNASLNVERAIQSRAVRAYNKQDFKTAYLIFEELAAKNPTESSMYLNAGVAAKQAKEYDAAIKNFKKVISLNAPNAKDLYLESINIRLSIQKDTAATLALVDEALAKFKDDPDFLGTQTDIYITRNEIEKAQGTLTKLIEKEPKKAIYQFFMGETYYRQALKVQEQRMKLDGKKVKEFNALSTKMNALIDKSLPFYLKALELDPKAKHTLEALKQIYAFKSDNVNYDKMKKMLDALK
jgi:tetratricopeptide (TPR) repeat protein